MKKAVGHRGSWFAKVSGKKYPCIHNQWLNGMHYLDPGIKLGRPRWDEYSAAIKNGLTVVLTQSRMSETGQLLRRGYVAIFAVSNVKITASGLEFDLIERLSNLA
jgi:hypothetical protein